MSTADQPRYMLPELAALAGVTPRTVRYYIAQGLLPPAPSSGPGAKYGEPHLARLRLIRRLQRDHQPLAAIRQQLERLDDATVVALEAGPTVGPARADSALEYIRRVLGAASPTERPAVAGPTDRPAAAEPREQRTAAPQAPAAWAAPSGTPPPGVDSASAGNAAADEAMPPAPAVASASAPPSPSTASPRSEVASPSAVPAPPPHVGEPIRSQWERIVLGPDVELHVRRPLTRSQSKRVDRLVAIGRELLEEDPT